MIINSVRFLVQKIAPARKSNARAFWICLKSRGRVFVSSFFAPCSPIPIADPLNLHKLLCKYNSACVSFTQASYAQGVFISDEENYRGSKSQSSIDALF